MCNLCVDGLNGNVCVRCTEVYVCELGSTNFNRYRELFNVIMTSKSHTNNLNNANKIYIKYIQDNAYMLDILLIEIITSYAKLCVLRNGITVRYVKIVPNQA